MAGSPKRIISGLSPAHYLSRRSVNRGLLGGSAVWRTVFALLFARRLYQVLSGTAPKLVTIEKLKPGQSMTITAIDPSTLPKKGRRGK